MFVVIYKVVAIAVQMNLLEEYIECLRNPTLSSMSTYSAPSSIAKHSASNLGLSTPPYSPPSHFGLRKIKFIIILDSKCAAQHNIEKVKLANKEKVEGASKCKLAREAVSRLDEVINNSKVHIALKINISILNLKKT